MLDKYFTVNIHEYIVSNDMLASLEELISTFDRSVKNTEVDGFLKRSAIEFSKKGQAATYLVFAERPIGDSRRRNY